MTESSREQLAPLRIGAVSYLNSKPLVYGLAAALPQAQIHYDLPSRLADALRNDELDLALIPIVEYLRHPESRIVSNACVACRGPVLSVRLFFRTPPAEVRTLALDEGSRTSATLARILLQELYGIAPKLCHLPIGEGLADTQADAVLLIGDRAMHPPEEHFSEVWDLGDRWCRWAELPFVFAAWVARPGWQGDVGAIATVLQQVRDNGLAHAAAIARREAPLLGIAEQTAHDYFKQNLHFTLGANELAGLREFARLAARHGLVGPDLPPFTTTPLANVATTHHEH